MSGSMIFFRRQLLFGAVTQLKLRTAVSLKAHVSTLVKIYARLLNRIIVHLLVNTAQLCNLLLSSGHSDHFFSQVILLLPSYHLMASY